MQKIRNIAIAAMVMLLLTSQWAAAQAIRAPPRRTLRPRVGCVSGAGSPGESRLATLRSRPGARFSTESLVLAQAPGS